MDGNPNVGPATIRDTLRAHRVLALTLLADRIAPLRQTFSQSGVTLPVSERLSASLERDEQELPETAAFLAGRYPHEASEPLRRKLAYIEARLAHTLARTNGEHPAEPGYDAPDRLARTSRRSRRASDRSSWRRAGSTSSCGRCASSASTSQRSRSARTRPSSTRRARALLPGYAPPPRPSSASSC